MGLCSIPFSFFCCWILFKKKLYKVLIRWIRAYQFNCVEKHFFMMINETFRYIFFFVCYSLCIGVEIKMLVIFSFNITKYVFICFIFCFLFLWIMAVVDLMVFAVPFCCIVKSNFFILIAKRKDLFHACFKIMNQNYTRRSTHTHTHTKHIKGILVYDWLHCELFIIFFSKLNQDVKWKILQIKSIKSFLCSLIFPKAILQYSFCSPKKLMNI